jgi:hypothetical protein
MTRTTYVSLFAYDPATWTNVSVFSDENGGYQVCVSTPMSWGCSWVGEDAITIDDKLGSATLAPTTVFVQMCDDSGYPICTNEEITVAITFEGTSDLIRSQSRYKSKNGCMYMFSGKTLARLGEATITIEGQSHEGEGYRAVSTNKIREQCKR